jgi:hypothetical protein
MRNTDEFWSLPLLQDVVPGLQTIGGVLLSNGLERLHG